jgi:hypothetical protein
VAATAHSRRGGHPGSVFAEPGCDASIREIGPGGSRPVPEHDWMKPLGRSLLCGSSHGCEAERAARYDGADVGGAPSVLLLVFAGWVNRRQVEPSSRYFVWFVIDLESRRVRIAGLARRPHHAWIQQLARNLTDRRRWGPARQALSHP